MRRITLERVRFKIAPPREVVFASLHAALAVPFKRRNASMQAIGDRWCCVASEEADGAFPDLVLPFIEMLLMILSIDSSALPCEDPSP